MRIVMLAAAAAVVGFALPAFPQGNNGNMNQGYGQGYN